MSCTERLGIRYELSGWGAAQLVYQ